MIIKNQSLGAHPTMRIPLARCLVYLRSVPCSISTSIPFCPVPTLIHNLSLVLFASAILPIPKKLDILQVILSFSRIAALPDMTGATGIVSAVTSLPPSIQHESKDSRDQDEHDGHCEDTDDCGVGASSLPTAGCIC